MNDCYGKFFIQNGALLPAELFTNPLVYDGDSYYEVIRVKNGLPVFFSDHSLRLQTSVSLAGRPMVTDITTLRNDIIRLCEAEKKQEINLKIVFNFNAGESRYLIYYIEPSYPTPEQYLNGVKGILFNAERRDPGVKIIDNQLRSEIRNRLIIEKGYEALLVNSSGCVTEGSRSNIFFITGNSLTTAPDESVLGGITRKHLIETCNENGLHVEFRCVGAGEISDHESVIMTGTSPVVLPFHSVDDILFNVRNSLITHLRNLILRKAEESMRQFANGH